MIVGCYADGGVVGSSPSQVGGAWAWCHVSETGEHVAEDAGFISAVELGYPVENNLTEFAALLRGIEALPFGWSGTVYSDSQNTIGRFSQGWNCRGIPPQAVQRMHAAVARLGDVTWIRLDGHPTKEHLERGVGKRGGPVSTHNVWCDRRCTAIIKAVKESHATPT